MRFDVMLAIAAMLGTSANGSSAQAVAGNDAVERLADGTQAVRLPPLPRTGPVKSLGICAADAGCHAGPWYMVETAEGLRECTEPFARPTACRPSTYGSQKLSRVWIVRQGSAWLWCQYPDLSGRCGDMHARPPHNLPVSAVQ